jgi:hypothetical protein
VLVDAGNWRNLAVGHVEEVRADDGFVVAPIVVNDGAAVAAIHRGDLREVSCGYCCDIDPSPGEFAGEKYDVVQRAIRYNHVALGPVGWGRAGRDVALRLDSEGNEMAEETVRLDALLAERDAAIAAAETLRKELAAANDPRRLDALVEDRLRLADGARKAGVTYAGRAPREVMAEVILRHDSSFTEAGKSDDYLRAYFDAVTRSNASLAAVRTDAVAPMQGTPTDAVADARKAMLERNKTAHREPLRYSRGV